MWPIFLNRGDASGPSDVGLENVDRALGRGLQERQVRYPALARCQCLPGHPSAHFLKPFEVFGIEEILQPFQAVGPHTFGQAHHELHAAYCPAVHHQFALVSHRFACLCGQPDAGQREIAKRFTIRTGDLDGFETQFQEPVKVRACRVTMDVFAHRASHQLIDRTT